MSEPRKRRIVRRLAIALALVAIALCVAHWYFSRGVDQRFVGTWVVATPTSVRAGDFYIFGRYGRGEVLNPSRTNGIRFSWKVDGTVLKSWRYNNKRTFSKWINREWELLWSQATTGQFYDDYPDYEEIVDIGPDEISLKYLEDNEQFTLRRLSE